MKFKKGDVYKEAKGSRWVRIANYNKNAYFEFNLISNTGHYHVQFEESFISQIRTGKLIKIPQLYK